MGVKPIARTAGFVAACVLAGLFAAPAPAVAQEAAAACRARIDLVRWDLNAIYAAGGLGGDRPVETYAALVTRLSASRARLEEGRPLESLDRLKEFEALVLALRDGAPARLSAADAQVLIFGNNDELLDEGVNGAIICVWLMDTRALNRAGPVIGASAGHYE